MKLKNHKTKNVILASLLMLSLLGLVGSPILASELTFADTCTEIDSTKCMTVKVTVPEVLAITNAIDFYECSDGSAVTTDGSGNPTCTTGTLQPKTIEISNTDGYSSSQSVVVKTNVEGGYKLIAKAISTDTESAVSNKMLRRDSDGVAISNTGIDSLSAKSTLANMAPNTWGLAVGAFDANTSLFRPVATTDAGIIAYSTIPVTADSTTVTFAANGGNSLVAGTYSARVQFTALANDGTAQTLYGD